MKSWSVTIQVKATELHFPVALFRVPYKVFLAFKSVDVILRCDYSNESYWAVLSCGAIYYVVQVGPTLCFCARGGSSVRTIEWSPLDTTVLSGVVCVWEHPLKATCEGCLSAFISSALEPSYFCSQPVLLTLSTFNFPSLFTASSTVLPLCQTFFLIFIRLSSVNRSYVLATISVLKYLT